jgi:hypothetical protein
MFNIMVTNPNSMTQIDSLDLVEPTNTTYYKSLIALFPNMQSTDIQSGVLPSTTTTVTTTTFSTTTTSSSSIVNGASQPTGAVPLTTSLQTSVNSNGNMVTFYPCCVYFIDIY